LGTKRDSHIISFNGDKGVYVVHKEGTDPNTFEKVKLGALREHPYELSREEKIYWVKTCPNLKDVPPAVLAQVPRQKEQHEIVDMIPVSKRSGKALSLPNVCFVKSTDL
jgi:hypothetical protein